jgi:hypothetical protein
MRPASFLYLAPLLLATASAQEPEPGAEGFLQAPSVVPSPVTPDGVEPDITIREEGD